MGLSPPESGDSRDHRSAPVEVAIVGAGISGIGTAIELLRRGRTSFVLLESGSELGGTWRDNTYPGVAVDILASSYSFSFETAFPWSRSFPPGHEILAYITHCAKKYGVDRHIRYDSRVARARFDEGRDRWSIELDNGEVLVSRHLISATGLFTSPKLPDIPGLDSFEGPSMHSGRWDHSHDFSGQRVAIIGTGASAVQIAPELAPQVDRLFVFQRTPIWISPRPDYPLNPTSPLSVRRFAAPRAALRFASELGIEALTFAIVNYRRSPLLVHIIQSVVRFLMRRQIHDPEMAAKLIPDYRLGCKRPAPSNTYLGTFNRENVELVTEGIKRICPEGIVTLDDTLHRVDTLVLATGFLTTERGSSPTFEILGRDGVDLAQFWEDHRLQAYAGVSVPGFPNFFLTAGPYSGGLNWFSMLKANLAHIMRCIDAACARGVTRVEVQRNAHDRYMRHMWRSADGTVFKDGGCATANSYYVDKHGDASLPLPRTPWWRALRGRLTGTRDYRFGNEAG